MVSLSVVRPPIERAVATGLFVYARLDISCLESPFASPFPVSLSVFVVSVDWEGCGGGLPEGVASGGCGESTGIRVT